MQGLQKEKNKLLNSNLVFKIKNMAFQLYDIYYYLLFVGLVYRCLREWMKELQLVYLSIYHRYHSKQKIQFTSKNIRHVIEHCKLFQFLYCNTHSCKTPLNSRKQKVFQVFKWLNIIFIAFHDRKLLNINK